MKRHRQLCDFTKLEAGPLDNGAHAGVRCKCIRDTHALISDCYCGTAGEQANNRELEAQITYYEREMGKARELQVCCHSC
jgi:hypothetical protein